MSRRAVTALPFDVSLAFAENKTSTASEDVGSVIDTKSTQYIEQTVVCNVSAIKTSAADETYKLVIEMSETAGFSVVNSVVERDVTLNDVGPVIIPFSNQSGGVVNRHIRARWVIAGTSPTITATVYLSTATNL